jgi:hypothetical protein
LLIEAERTRVNELFRSGKLTDEARRRIERELDLREAHLANLGPGRAATLNARLKRRRGNCEHHIKEGKGWTADILKILLWGKLSLLGNGSGMSALLSKADMVIVGLNVC